MNLHLHLHMHLCILKKMDRNVKKYSSHILRYINICEYINIYICYVIKKAKYDL